MMKTIQIHFPDGSNRNIYHADTFFTRFLGLMGRRSVPGQGLLLDPCNSVHMFFMRIPIDIVFARREKNGVYRVLGIQRYVKPWQWVGPVRKTTHVFELPAGAADGLNIGEWLTFG